MARPSDNELFPNVAWQLLLPDYAPSAIEALGPSAPRLAATSGSHSRLRGGHRRVALVGADDVNGLSAIPLADADHPADVGYLEAPWPRRISTRELRRQLDTDAYHAVGLYSVSPAPDRWQATWWIPTGEPHVVRFVAGQLHTSRASIRNWRELPQRLVAGLAQMRPQLVAGHPWLLHPQRPQLACAVLTRFGADVRRARIPEVARTAAKHLGLPPSTPAQVAVQVGGSSTDQPILFAFYEGAPNPSVVVKAPTRSEEIEATTHEAEMYRHLAAVAPRLAGIPRSMEIMPDGPSLLVGQTFVPGPPVTRIVTGKTFAALAERVTDWLIDLGVATRTPVDRGWSRELAASALESMGRMVDPTRVAPGLLTLLADAVAGDGVSFTVCQHNDFGPWNIHLDPAEGLGVIDWADARTSGPPVFDLIYFLTHLGLCAADGYGFERRGRVVNAMLDPDTAEGQTIERCLARYGAALGINHDDLRRLRLLTWILKFTGEASERRASSLYLELLHHELGFRPPS